MRKPITSELLQKISDFLYFMTSSGAFWTMGEDSEYGFPMASNMEESTLYSVSFSCNGIPLMHCYPEVFYKFVEQFEIPKERITVEGLTDNYRCSMTLEELGIELMCLVSKKSTEKISFSDLVGGRNERS